MDPLEILPPELWEMVFSQVKDAQDWINLFRASPSFEAVVGNERSTALLPQVFPHVQKYLGNGLRQMLALRLLARQWKEAVDKTVEMASDDDDKGNAATANRIIKSKYIFSSSESISSFLTKFDAHHHQNPFIGSNCCFTFAHVVDDENRRRAEFRNLVARLMAKFGNQIKGMKLIITDDESNLSNLFVVCHLKSILTSAPNLVALDVKFYSQNGIFETNLPASQSLSDIHSAPPGSTSIICKLESFSFGGRTRRPSSWRNFMDLQNMLFQMCCCNPDYLKRVKLIGVPMELIMPFPNLKTAELVVPDGEEDECYDGPSCLPTNANYPLQLSSLTLSPSCGWVPLRFVFDYAEYFKETLTSLRISKGCPNGMVQLRLDLPRLKHLTIPYQNFHFSFLQGLSNLEVLRVFHNLRGEKGDMESFISDMEMRMAKARAWELFPKLRRIQLKGNSKFGRRDSLFEEYSREDQACRIWKQH